MHFTKMSQVRKCYFKSNHTESREHCNTVVLHERSHVKNPQKKLSVLTWESSGYDFHQQITIN